MNPPKRRAKPDWADVYELVVEHVNALAEGEVDEHTAHETMHEVFNAALEAIYGDPVKTWYPAALKAVIDEDSEGDDDDEVEDDEEDDDDEFEDELDENEPPT